MLIIGQNSWATILEADAYMETKVRVTEWFSLPDIPVSPGQVAKETLLTDAFNWLIGSSQVDLSPTLTDENIKKAQVELSWYIYKYGEEVEDREMMIDSGVKSFRFSKKAETLKDFASLPDRVISLLPDYYSGNSFVCLKGQYDA